MIRKIFIICFIILFSQNILAYDYEYNSDELSIYLKFDERQISSKDFNNLRRGKYEPYFPSTDIKDRFKEIAKDLGVFDVYKLVLPTLRAMRTEMKFTIIPSEKAEDGEASKIIACNFPRQYTHHVDFLHIHI